MTRSHFNRALEDDSWEPLADARNWSKARVYVGEFPVGSGQIAVAKDISTLPLWFRWIYARLVLRREWRALRALDEVEGVPRALHRIDADGFIMERCEGHSLHTLPLDEAGAELLERLDEIVRQVHQKGVTHGDLHRDNIMRAPDGRLNLIDWATAHVYGPCPRGAKKRAFGEFRALDVRAVAKIKAYSAPQLLSEAEREILAQGGSKLYRGVKKLRGALHALRRKKSNGIDYRELVK